MIINLPFRLIWGYCAWLHREWQLKCHILFILLYLYGLAEYYFFRVR